MITKINFDTISIYMFYVNGSNKEFEILIDWDNNYSIKLQQQQKEGVFFRFVAS